MMLAYLKILRPINGLMSVFAVFIAAVLVGFPISSLELMLAFAVVFLISSAGMVINDYFDYEIDPDKVYNDEQLEINIDPISGELRVASVNEWWNGEKVPVRIYCDDDPEFEFESNPYQDIFVNIIGLNDDAPYWSPIPDVHITEDIPVYDAVVLPDHVMDTDDDIDDLIFSVRSNTNPTKIKIALVTPIVPLIRPNRRPFKSAVPLR